MLRNTGDDFELSISLPLDSDGFLRRECPTCQSEFKWRVATDDSAATEPSSERGYHCPICNAASPPDSWWTKAQLRLAEETAAKEVLGPELERLAEQFQGSSSDFFEVGVETSDIPEPQALTESDDMRRVDFSCHPAEPVKVADGFDGEVHCPICGTPTSRKSDEG